MDTVSSCVSVEVVSSIKSVLHQPKTLIVTRDIIVFFVVVYLNPTSRLLSVTAAAAATGTSAPTGAAAALVRIARRARLHLDDAVVHRVQLGAPARVVLPQQDRLVIDELAALRADDLAPKVLVL